MFNVYKCQCQILEEIYVVWKYIISCLKRGNKFKYIWSLRDGLFKAVLYDSNIFHLSLFDRDGIKGLWFVNQESLSWSHKPKICKTFIFLELFIPKCGKFKIISTDDIDLSLCLVFKEWGWTIKEQHSKNYLVCTLKLKLSKFFSQSSIFFLIPTLFDGALRTTDQTKLSFAKCFIELHFSEGKLYSLCLCLYISPQLNTSTIIIFTIWMMNTPVF